LHNGIRIDLSSLLVADWRHGAIWRAMRKVDPATTYFVRDWAEILCSDVCTPKWPGYMRHEFWTQHCQAHQFWYLLEDAREAEWQGVTVDPKTGLMVCALAHHGPHARSAHTFDYWLKRLQAVRQARADISRAQGLAEQAWRWYEAYDDTPVEQRPSALDELMEAFA